MIETRQGDKYVKAFHDKHPNTIVVKSEAIRTLNELWERTGWSKENLCEDVLITISKADKNLNITVIWHCVSEIDATAVKLAWG